MSNVTWVSMWRSSLSDADSHANLEIDVRDKVIDEMSELINYQNKDISKAELLEFLSSGFDPLYVKDEDQWIYFRSLKFEFKDGRLSKVYW